MIVLNYWWLAFGVVSLLSVGILIGCFLNSGEEYTPSGDDEGYVLVSIDDLQTLVDEHEALSEAQDATV